jgi:hypothetical protein
MHELLADMMSLLSHRMNVITLAPTISLQLSSVTFT